MARAPATDSAKQISARANASGSRSITSPRLKPGNVEGGQAVGHRAHDRHAVVLQVEDGDHGDPEHDHEQHGRHFGGVRAQHEDDRQRHDADGQRQQAGVAELGDQVGQLAEEPGAAAFHAQQLGQLADADDQGEAGDEAGQHRAREEVGDEPGAREPGGQQQRADQQGEQRGEGDEAGGVAERDLCDRGRRVRGDRRARADRELPAGAEDRVREQRRQGGEQAGRRRQARERGIGDALRHEHGPDGGRRDDVRSQPAPLVARQPVADGQRRRFQSVPGHEPSRHAHVLLVGPRLGRVPGGILRRAVVRPCCSRRFGPRGPETPGVRPASLVHFEQGQGGGGGGVRRDGM